ncbi:MAG: flagellin N-terminal helical domain-containing protein [Acidimicrobiales bacterium]
MSISQLALNQTLANQLSTKANDVATLQMQIASGQALNQPSDNPAAVTQVLALSSQAAQLTSYQANAEAATSWLGTANGVANGALQVMGSANTLLLQAANQGTQTANGYEAMGRQLQGMVSNLLQLANTQYGGRALFAGTAAVQNAYDSTGNYLGNADTPSAIIGAGMGAGQKVALSVPGSALFGAGAANVFATLTTVANALLTGTPTQAQISTASTALAGNIATAEQASVVLGNATQEASMANASLTTQLSNVQANSANLKDVNIAQATSQLGLDTASYQAALWAASKSIPETLMSFIS